MSAPHISQRALKTPPSPIRRLAGLAHDAEQRGTKVYRLNIGQPDVRSPREFLDGVHRYNDEVVAYEGSKGNTALLHTWSSYINRSYDLGLTEKEMLITAGASEALIFSFMVCCDPGDEILIFDPTYANYMGFAAISGVRLVPLPSGFERDFKIAGREEIERYISPYTRAILLCNPNNPTGTVCSDDELRMLIDVCHKNDIFLIVDETYREFVYDGIQPRCIYQLAPRDPRIIVVDSLSKRFSLCGARVGCLITWHQEVMKGAFHIAQARLSAPSIEQYAAAQMLESIGAEYLMAAHGEYRARRDVAVRVLAGLEGVQVHTPQGGFYLLAKIPVDDAEDFATFMLTEFSYEGETVFVAPAAGFYMHREAGRSTIRIAFVLCPDDTERALRVLGKGIEAYRRRAGA